MWDELHVRLTFERRYIWYFMQAYVPTYLTIFIRSVFPPQAFQPSDLPLIFPFSWVSFSLGSKAIPARTMLGVNALLVGVF